ncbi:MAG TPA: hypothetical protein VGD54_05805 [Steroidobacteraceae bacterium]
MLFGESVRTAENAHGDQALLAVVAAGRIHDNLVTPRSVPARVGSFSESRERQSQAIRWNAIPKLFPSRVSLPKRINQRANSKQTTVNKRLVAQSRDQPKQEKHEHKCNNV